MPATMWLPPLVKALATALLVVSASAVAEALGPFWGALIASLPVSAGPAYVFLAMQHNADFVAASALSSFAANAATGLFLIVYGRLASGSSAMRSLTLAILAWFVASLATRQVDWTPATALALNFAVYGVGFALLSTTRSTEARRAAQRRRFDLPVRAAAVAIFVTAVVAVSTILGPAATGIAAVFPISLISLIVIVRARSGGLTASLFAASALRGMLGFGISLLTLHLVLKQAGIPAAFLAALLVSATWSVALPVLSRRPGAIPRSAARQIAPTTCRRT